MIGGVLHWMSITERVYTTSEVYTTGGVYVVQVVYSTDGVRYWCRMVLVENLWCLVLINGVHYCNEHPQ